MRRVVVTGLGCVSPLGLNVADTWQGLMQNRSGISHVDDVEGFWDGWKDPQSLGLTTLIAGGVPGGGAFKASSRQSRATLFALRATEEAMLSSGDLAAYLSDTPGATRSTGVALGTGMSSLMDIADVTRNLDAGAAKRVSPFFVPKILCNAAAGQIGIQHKLNGPNHSASTACATGAHGIGDGFRMIREGDADVMICGGTEACLNPIAFVGFQRAKAMTTEHNGAPSEGSRPFDRDRKGFVMAEGAAVLILEELGHAQRRGAPILAEVGGYGLSGDGYHVTSPHPDGVGTQLCMASALRQAQRLLDTQPADLPFAASKSSEVSYVNAHATSTPTGDEIESNSIEQLCRESVPEGQKLYVSSTKGHVGHLLGAAGALEALVSIKSLTEGIAPGTLNLSNPPESQNVEFSPEPQAIAKTLVMSNSFGFGGTNTSLVFCKHA